MVWHRDGGGVAKLDGDTWTVYDEEDGLVCNYISELSFDKNGVLWIGTLHGISSFDGKSWTTYTTENSGLANNNIISITIDKDNVKWFGTINSGVSTFDGTVWKTLTEKDGLWGILWMQSQSTTMVMSGWEHTADYRIIPEINGHLIPKKKTVFYVMYFFRWHSMRMVCCGAVLAMVLPVLMANRGLFIQLVLVTTFLTAEASFLSTSMNTGVKWFGSIVGVWRYDGDTWTSYSRRESGLEKDVYVRALLTDNEGKKWIGTRDALTSVQTDESPKLEKKATPKQTVIFNNYPNPFNPDTTIEFVLPESGLVTVSIYNVTGQKIRSLVSDNMSAGKHTVVWDGQKRCGFESVIRCLLRAA